jgi:hypothetical protein
VLKGAPDNILASRFLAECLEGLGDLAGAAARYKSTLLLSPGDRQVQARLDSVEERLRKGPGGAAAEREPAPIRVVEVDEPMVLEAAHEGRVVETTGQAFERPAPASQPAAFVEESFEVERPPEPIPWKSELYVPEGEVVFEADDEGAATIPPGRPSGALEEVMAAATMAEPGGAAPLAVESEVVAEVEPLVEPEPAPAAEASLEAPTVVAEAGPEPPLASPTLGELYFNQGFTDKALEVYRQLLEREPANERVRARLAEIQALDRHLRAEELREAPAPAGPAPAAPAEPDQRSRRREAVERTIARLEGFLAAVRKG